MVRFQWKRTVDAAPTTPTPSASLRDDLRIRNLLDDPRLARAMALELGESFDAAAPLRELVQRPQPVFNRRRLLESDAA